MKGVAPVSAYIVCGEYYAQVFTYKSPTEACDQDKYLDQQNCDQQNLDHCSYLAPFPASQTEPGNAPSSIWGLDYL